MSKSPKIFNTYYSRIELKHFDLKIFNNIRGVSTGHYVRRLVIIFCAKMFSIFSNKYFGTNVPKKLDKKNLTYVKMTLYSQIFLTISNDLIFTKISNDKIF